MEFRDRILEIAHYRGDLTHVCRSCGIMHKVDLLEIEAQVFENGKTHARATCPDCGSFMKYLNMSALDRLFDFDEKRPLPVAELSDSLITWYFNKGAEKEKIKAAKEFVKRGLIL